MADQLWRELRLAVRRLWGTPVFTAFAAISLALGLGVTTAIYSTVGSFFWTSASIPEADHLGVITRVTPDAHRSWRNTISRQDFDRLRRYARTAPEWAASSMVGGDLTDGTQTSRFTGDAVTGNYFAMLKLPTSLGRGIMPTDDRPGADPVVVVSYDFWRSKAGGDRGVLGRTVRLGKQSFVVIGVAAESVRSERGLDGQYGFAGDGWIPLSAKPLMMGDLTASPDQPDLTVMARLPQGVGVEAVAAEVGALGAALDRVAPLPYHDAATDPAPAARRWSASSPDAIAREDTGATRKAGGAIVLLVGLVLVVACTNIANLMLGRGTSRQQEFAVRRALGASRARLIREQCAESVVLAVLGGLGALLVARLLLQSFATDIPQGSNFQMIALHPTLNARALVLAAGSLLAALVVFGVVPALQLTRATLGERMAGETAGLPRSRWKGRRRLIAWQVTISTAFLLIAAASVRAVTAEARHDPGFDLQHLAVGFVPLRSMEWDADRVQLAIANIDRAAHARPGFVSVAIAASLPLGRGIRLSQFAQVSKGDSGRVSAARAIPATPEIFRTLGVPILHGRGFDDEDTVATSGVIVVSERVARAVFGTADVVGMPMTYQAGSDAEPKTLEVIGIARDTDPMGAFDPNSTLGTAYVPLAQENPTSLILVGRTAGDPAPMTRTFAEIVRQAEPDLGVEFAGTGTLAMRPQVFVLRLAAILSGGLSILAVTLAMLGLYGVLSHLVARRTREIGLRVALGAEASDIRMMIVGDGLRPVLWGLGVGLFVGVAARLVLRAMISGQSISAIDPLAFAVAATTLLVAGLLACDLPARRASNVDPNVALRDL